MSGTKPGLISVLLVEDNPGDVRLFREALLDRGVKYELAVASDGVEALAYLDREWTCNGDSRPDLIFLDLNLPQKTGLEVLQVAKQDADLAGIPVILFPSSAAPTDIDRAYDFGANYYVTKPADPDTLFQTVENIERFWLGTAKLPNHVGCNVERKIVQQVDKCFGIAALTEE